MAITWVVVEVWVEVWVVVGVEVEVGVEVGVVVEVEVGVEVGVEVWVEVGVVSRISASSVGRSDELSLSAPLIADWKAGLRGSGLPSSRQSIPVAGHNERTNQMKINEYVSLLQTAMRRKRKILGVGKPGVGKSYGAKQACDLEGWDLISLCCPLLSPVKVGGYPRPPVSPDGDATHCFFDGIALAMRATRPTLLFWDDLGMAGGETLKAIVELVQFGRVDGRTLPECVVQCGATNDVGHGADVQGLIEPLKTRWHSIVNVETSLDDVVQYGLAKGWPSDLLAFLRNEPSALHDWKPSKSMSIDGATPRGWDYAGQWIHDGIDDPEVIAGCVGKGRATEYLVFRGLINELPDIDAVLVNPESAPVPENPSARYLVAMALASRMSAKNFGACIKYLQRLPEMFLAFSVRDAFKAEESKKKAKTLPCGYAVLASSRDFTAWVTSAAGREIIGAMSS